MASCALPLQCLIFIFFPLFQIKAFCRRKKERDVEYWRSIHVLKQKVLLIHGFWKNIYDGSSAQGKDEHRERKSLLFYCSALIVFFSLRNMLAQQLQPVGAGWMGAAGPTSFLVLRHPSPRQRQPVPVGTEACKRLQAFWCLNG